MIDFTVDTIISKDIQICQPKKPAFRFGCDSVILSYFAQLKTKWHVADIGSGSGVIAAICAKAYGVTITAIELQTSMFDCLQKTVELCNLQKQIIAVHSNIKDFRAEKRFDAVICNPPYRKINTGRESLSQEERIARFDSEMNLETLADFCRKNLKHGGKLFFSYDADMFANAVSICRKENMEPKRIRFLHPNINSKAKLVFMECVFGGGNEVTIEPPLFQKGIGTISAEYENLFKGNWQK